MCLTLHVQFLQTLTQPTLYEVLRDNNYLQTIQFFSTVCCLKIDMKVLKSVSYQLNMFFLKTYMSTNYKHLISCYSGERGGGREGLRWGANIFRDPWFIFRDPWFTEFEKCTDLGYYRSEASEIKHNSHFASLLMAQGKEVYLSRNFYKYPFSGNWIKHLVDWSLATVIITSIMKCITDMGSPFLSVR